MLRRPRSECREDEEDDPDEVSEVTSDDPATDPVHEIIIKQPRRTCGTSASRSRGCNRRSQLSKVQPLLHRCSADPLPQRLRPFVPPVCWSGISARIHCLPAAI